MISLVIENGEWLEDIKDGDSYNVHEQTGALSLQSAVLGFNWTQSRVIFPTKV